MTNQNSDNLLIEGIIQSARKEAEKILSKAKDEVKTIQADNQARLDSAVAEEKTKYESEMRTIRGRYESQVNAYQRHLDLKRRSALYEQVMTVLEDDLKQIPKRKDYPEILKKWIVEGILGLDLTEVTVSCSEKDPISQAVLDECAQMALDRTGKTYKVRLGYTKLIESGVIISSVDQRVSFNNLISSRVRRYKSEINDIVEGCACKIE